MYNKRSFVFILFLIINLQAFSSENFLEPGLKGKRLSVEEPSLKNLDTNDKLFFSDLSQIVRIYLRDYMGYEIVDNQNYDKIKKQQAKSEEMSFDASTALEAGKIKFAEYNAFTEVNKKKDSYSISLKITDLTTGDIVAEDMIQNIKKITDVSEIGIKKLILKIAPKLGVELTSIGKYSLDQNSNKEISTEEELNLAKQQENSLQNTLNKLNKQIANYALQEDSIEINALTKKAELEVEQAMVQQRLEIAQQNALRIQKQKEMEFIEKTKNLERSEEQRQKISDLSNRVDKLAADIRNKKMDSLVFYEKIEVIEKEKKEYLNLKEKIDSEVKKIFNDAENEYQNKKIDLNDISQYKKAELSYGVPTEAAKKIRDEKNKKLYESLMNEAKRNEQALHKQSKLDEVLNDININESELKSKQQLSSITNDIILEIKEYDGEKKAWDAYIHLSYNGGIFSDSLKIEFNNLASALNNNTYSNNDMIGKNPEKYEQYLQDVDLYDSLFRMSTPLLYLECDLYVESLSKDEPSCYNLNILEYRVKAITTNKIVYNKKPSESIKIVLNPAYDVRTEEQLKIFYDKQRLEQLKISKKNDQERKNLEQKIQQEQIVQEKKEKQLQRKEKANSMKKSNFVLSYANSFGGYVDPAILFGSYEFTLGKPIFMSFDMAYMFNTNDFDLGMKVGIFKYLPILNYPCIFAAVGAGFRGYSIQEETEDPVLGYYLVGEIGVDIPLFSPFGLQIKYQLEFSRTLYFSDRIFVGITI